MKLEELALFSVIGYAAFRFLDSKREMANEGELQGKPIVAAASGKEAGLAPVSGIDGRDPNVSCAIKPPEMLSTSLLPAENQPMTDSDFVGITPEKLQAVNFLSSGWALGRDTQTNTLRNPSYDLRSEPVNPQSLTLSNNSFSNTTIAPQQYSRQFEIQNAMRDQEAEA